MISIVLVIFCALHGLLVAEPPQVDFALSEAYRRERLDFTISGPHGTPDVLSELIFKHITVYATRLDGKVRKGRYFLEGFGSYGSIFSGKVVDNDYRFSHRRGKYSHSSHHITGDYTADYGLRLGYQSRLLRFSTGYASYYQKLRFKGGHDWAGCKDFSKLNSTFCAKWFGPEWGIGYAKSLSTTVDFIIDYRLLYPLCYHAKGHWNLREKEARHFDLKSRAIKSYGNIVNFSSSWNFFRTWKLIFQYEFMKFYAKDGHMHIKDGKVPLNKAHLTSHEIRCSVGYTF